MSYTTNEKDEAILLIGSAKGDLQNQTLYEDLEKKGLISIIRLNGRIDKVELTFSGRQLFNRLQNLAESKNTKIY